MKGLYDREIFYHTDNNDHQQNVIPLSISTITGEYNNQKSKDTFVFESTDTNTKWPKRQSDGADQRSHQEAGDGLGEFQISNKNISNGTTVPGHATTMPSGETKEPDKTDMGSGLDIVNSQQKLCEKESKMITQVVCAIVVSMTQLGCGTMFSFSGITLPQMNQPESQDIYLPPTYASLFGSIVTIGAAFGGLMCGRLVDKIGHLKTLILCQPIFLILWIILAFSYDPLVAVIARGFQGVMTGIITPCSTAYILEIAHKDHRGILFAAIPIAKQVGFLFLGILGITSLSWRNMALICGVPTTVLPFIGLFFFPRSPRWLVTKGMNQEAQKSLSFFRGKNYNSQPELEEIITQVEKDKKVQDIQTQCRELLRKPVLNSFMILLFLSIFGNFHGSPAVNSFTVIIFADSSATDAYTCAILIAVARMIGQTCYLILIDRIGRRPLHIYAYAAISISLVVIGVSFYMKEAGWSTYTMDWMLLASVLIYTYFISLGLSVLLIMQGELLPTSVRPLGMSILTFFLFLGAFTITQVYFPMVEALTVHGTFWTYGVGSMVVAIISHFSLPETNGRSLEEIGNGKRHIVPP